MTTEQLFPYHTKLTNEECHQIIPQAELETQRSNWNKKRGKPKIPSTEEMSLSGHLSLYFDPAGKEKGLHQIRCALEAKGTVQGKDGKTHAFVFRPFNERTVLENLDAAHQGRFSRMAEEAAARAEVKRAAAKKECELEDAQRGLTNRTFFSGEERKMLGLALVWLMDPRHPDELAREKAREILLSLSQPSEYEKGVKEGMKMAKAIAHTPGLGFATGPFFTFGHPLYTR